MEEHKVYKDPIKEKTKTWIFGIIFFLLIVYSRYATMFKTTNEIGFMGMDKVGRQVFIQSMDSYFDPNINVDSDFFDHNFFPV